ncbi:hypothetical protein DPMN_170044 [Dreissena polymorpha]|uniref:Uncharacterized protein n=1 Tax=Dreissena polymorpha TaxID=45954 RepID=A0A9D4IE82_DREPO|nr:hypothetical protein DPMN_170044 [Dreissena polymorpha]
MKIARWTVDALRLERVHQMPSQPIAGRARSVVARFAFFKDRETVRQQWSELKGKKLCKRTVSPGSSSAESQTFP